MSAPAENPAWPEEVRVRWRTAHATALSNAAAIQTRTANFESFEPRLQKLLLSNQAKHTKMRAFHRLVEEFTAEAKPPYVACKSGCAHCCHIAVPVHPLEAKMISETTGRAMTTPESLTPKNLELQSAIASYDNPCPFLKDNLCSIYESRPLTCRVHFNLDEDELLCRLEKGSSIQVPYMDVTPLRMAYLRICGTPELADIRDFFPKEHPPQEQAK